jgi:methyl-accepting chemotaxis protein
MHVFAPFLKERRGINVKKQARQHCRLLVYYHERREIFMQMMSIKTKLTVAIVVLLLLSVSILGSVGYWNARKIIIQDMERSLTELSKSKAQELGVWFAQRKSEVSFLANSPTVVDGTLETALTYLKNEQKRNPVFASFMMMDDKGDANFTSGQKANMASRGYFKQVMAGQTVVSDPVVAKNDGSLVVVPIAPITRNGAVVGGLAGGVGLGEVIKLVDQVKVGSSGYGYVVQSDGLMVFHPNKDLVMKLNAVTDPAAPPDLKTITAKMVKGEQGVSQYTYKGIDKYVAYAPIPGSTWSFAVTVPKQEVLQKLDTLLWASVGITVIVFILSVCLSLYITSSITRPLNAMKLMLQDIAQGDGDLTKRLDARSNDELGEVSRCFNTFVDKLQGIIIRIARTTELVAAASNQLNQTAGRMAHGADAVTAQVTTVATAGEEMSATAGDIAKNCGMAVEGSQQASAAAVSGAQVVEETISVMSDIAQRVRNSAHAVESLGTRSEQIGAIVGTIEDIADQTNLLALNAAIEAARAGEQGRGFAVVADEVRALAERTTRATREISDMIKAIQKDTGSAVDAMEAGVGEVAKGSEKAADSGEALERILAQINEVTMQIHQVATAAEEQTATTSEISNNMHQITTVIAETSRGAQETSAAAVQLSGHAEELKKIVGQFKL